MTGKSESINQNFFRMIKALGLGFIMFASCEDVIDVALEDGGVQVVVDAWVNNLPVDQELFLSSSQPYFDNTNPPPIVDAIVKLTREDGNEFNFEHRGAGRYVWTSNGDSLGSVGNGFILEIQAGETSYTAQNEISRVPEIDSIGIEFRENEIFLDDGLYAQFYARDFEGKGDTYWIKTYKNDSLLDKTQELNIAYDAGFDAGTGIDGLVFIPPIRELINAVDEDLISQPYAPGDQIRVEIHSISNGAFDFMEIARDQINNGDNGIFSIPLANTRSNISSSDGSLVLGYFNIAAISMREETVEE